MLLLGTVMKSAARIAKVKSPKRRSAPNTVNGTVPPPRIENVKRRPREYLTVKEVGKLLDGARDRGRYGHRDATMILVGYRQWSTMEHGERRQLRNHNPCVGGSNPSSATNKFSHFSDSQKA